jgi:hypothetical protein
VGQNFAVMNMAYAKRGVKYFLAAGISLSTSGLPF